MGKMDAPLQKRKCPDCGATTYEEEGYGCDCQDECPECGEVYPEGPHKECYDHYGCMDEDTQVEMFAQLLEERNRLKKERDGWQNQYFELISDYEAYVFNVGKRLERMLGKLEAPDPSLEEVVSETEVTY